jgi:hypothetical protein
VSRFVRAVIRRACSRAISACPLDAEAAGYPADDIYEVRRVIFR